MIRFITLTSTASPTELSFSATPPSDPHRPFDVITARAINKSLSETHLPILYGIEAESDLPRELYPTTTYPVVRGATGLFGATFVNGGADVEVGSFDITIPGGYDLEYNDGEGARLFAEFTTPRTTHGTVQDGTWTWIDERHVRWTPSDARNLLVVPQGGVASWLVELPINASEDLRTSIEPASSEGAVATLEFENGYVARSSVWGATPGLVRVRVPPDDLSTLDVSDGYPWSPDEGVTHTFDIEASLPWATVPGAGSYALTSAATETIDTESALAGASFHVRDRLAPLGSFVQVDADLQSVMTELAAAGVESTTFKVEMYAPPSMGCDPTTSVELPFETLPTSASPAVVLVDVDGLGQESLFLANEDGHAYRIDGDGVTGSVGIKRWATELPASGSAVSVADFGDGPRVLVGDASGQVSLLDATTGAIVAGPVDAGSGAVASILTSETESRFVVATTLGDVSAWRADGTLLGAWTDPLLEDVAAPSAPAIYWGQDGDVVAVTAAELYKLHSGDLATLGHFSLRAFAVSVHGDSVRLLAIDGLYEASYASFDRADRVEPKALVTATAADLDGDLIPELVGVDENMTVHAWRGSGGTRWWHALIEQDRVESAEAIMIAADPELSDACATHPGIETYEISASCEITPESLKLAGHSDQIFAFDASSDGVAVGYRSNGVTRFGWMDADGGDRWDRAQKEGVLPVAVARGTWGGSSAALVSGDDGIVRIFDTAAPAADAMYQASTSAYVGRFTMMIPVPDGGFYGAHLLVASVSWIDADGETRAARLADWFCVVGSDGKPVIEPAYRIVLVVGSSDASTEPDED